MAHLNHLKWYGPWQRVFAEGLSPRWKHLLQRWLVKQRWYLEKDSSSTNIHLQDAILVEVHQHMVWWLILRSETTSGSRHYQIPLVFLHVKPEQDENIVTILLGHESGFVVDAWNWPPFAQWVLQQMNGTPQPARLLCWQLEQFDTTLPAEVMPGSHSNTGIRFADHYFMKVQRLLAEGLQPDEEMGRELSSRGSLRTIPLLGGLQYRTGETTATLATVSKYTPSDGNGWDWLLRHVVAAGAGSEHHRNGMLQSVRLLAQRTAELHQLLALPSDHQAFSIEPFQTHDVKALQQRVWERVNHTTALLRRHRNALKHAHKLIDAWLCIDLEPIKLSKQLMLKQPCCKQRIHGDYHLGQVLRTADDWLIIDFEGEPLRPLAERRAKDSPVRDVAGMIRSLHYAQAVSLQRKPDLEPVIQLHFAQLITGFLDSYSTHAEPAVRDSLPVLLPLYLLEKALYEVEYEVRSRPEWVGIPLGGAIELLQGFSA